MCIAFYHIPCGFGTSESIAAAAKFRLNVTAYATYDLSMLYARAIFHQIALNIVKYNVSKNL